MARADRYVFAGRCAHPLPSADGQVCTACYVVRALCGCSLTSSLHFFVLCFSLNVKALNLPLPLTARDMLSPSLLLPRERSIELTPPSATASAPVFGAGARFAPNPTAVLIKQSEFFAASATGSEQKTQKQQNKKKAEDSEEEGEGEEEEEEDVATYYLHMNFANENVESGVHCQLLVDRSLVRLSAVCWCWCWRRLCAEPV